MFPLILVHYSILSYASQSLKTYHQKLKYFYQQIQFLLFIFILKTIIGVTIN